MPNLRSGGSTGSAGLASATAEPWRGKKEADVMRGTYQWDDAFRDVSEDGAKLRAYLGVGTQRLEVVK